MSALSELCDKLRGWAEQMRKIQDPVLSTVVAKDVERAADIIWNLRNLLNDAYNKNDKLSELQMDTWHLLQEVHGKHSADMGVAPRMAKLHQRMRNLGVEKNCCGRDLGECWSCPHENECMAKDGGTDDG